MSHMLCYMDAIHRRIVENRMKQLRDEVDAIKRVNLDAETDQKILDDVVHDIHESVESWHCVDGHVDGYMDATCYPSSWRYLRDMTTERKDRLTQHLNGQGFSRYEIVVIDDAGCGFQLYSENK